MPKATSSADAPKATSEADAKSRAAAKLRRRYPRP